jgi:predicted Fe-S protein YdhL (DUF1289 family)
VIFEMMMSEPVISPCIKVCAIDGKSNWCLGCGRTLPEITECIKMGPAARQSVLDELPMRIAALIERGKR